VHDATVWGRVHGDTHARTHAHAHAHAHTLTRTRTRAHTHAQGFKATVLHGGKTQDGREQVQRERERAEGGVWTKRGVLGY
jgi:hypothetical protein